MKKLLLISGLLAASVAVQRMAASDVYTESPGTEGNGRYTIGPDYTVDPDLTDLGNPKGKRFEFTMRLADSKFFRGDDATLEPTKAVRKERLIAVYVPAAYKDGTEAPILVMHDGPRRLDQVSNAAEQSTVVVARQGRRSDREAGRQHWQARSARRRLRTDNADACLDQGLVGRAIARLVADLRLLDAVKARDHKALEALVEEGADVNATQPDGTPALNAAVGHGSVEAASALIDAGAQVTVADKSGNTPLHLAAQAVDLKLVEKLLAAGADPNVRTARSAGGGRRSFFRAPTGEMTPLLLAARTGREDLMRMLLDAGADPKARAQDGTTLLMQAINSAKLPFVQFVFGFDSDVLAVTDAGHTVMHASVAGTSRNGTQDEICEVIQFLADHGAALDPIDNEGYTPIRISDIIPTDKASLLLHKLIVASGVAPKVMPSDLL